MRKAILLGYAVLGMALTSCETIDTDALASNQSTTTADNTPTKNVKFKVSGLDTEMQSLCDTAITRAALADASLTDLYIYAGDTLLVHQQSTDTDFGQPNIKMKYGPHKLAFIATKGTTNTIEKDSIFTPGKVKDTFAKYCTLTVNATTLQQSVTMQRAVSCLRLTIEDATSAAITQCDVTIGSYGKALILPYLHGQMEADHTSSVTIPDGYLTTAGISINTYLYTPEIATEYTTTVRIDFKDATGAVLYTHTVTDVPLLTNRVTNIHGKFFTSGIANSISLASTDWTTALEVSL